MKEPLSAPRGGLIRRLHRGQALLEWMIGAAIGLTLVMASASVFTEQLRTLRETVLRQRRERDLQDVMEHLRRELRRAGLSHDVARTADHDAILLEGGSASLQLHYRSDSADPTRATGRSTVRLQQKALQWRTPSTGGFQQLLDPQLLPLAGWNVRSQTTEPCRSRLTVVVNLGPPNGDHRQMVVRRRNEASPDCSAASKADEHLSP